MAITITLADDLVAGLTLRAQRQRLSLEQLALSILSAALEDPQVATPLEVVKRIQAMPRDEAQVIPATADLEQALRSGSGDPSFELESWNRQWSVVEGEMKATTRGNDIAEGRGG